MENKEIIRLTSKKFLTDLNEAYFEEKRSVGPGWFIPFCPVEDRIHSEIFLREWLKFGSELDYFSLGWSTRLEAILQMSGCPNTEYYGRVTASVFAWLGTNVGLSHVETFVKKVNDLDLSAFGNRSNLGIEFWSEVFCFNPHGNFVLGYKLKSLLCKSNLEDLTYHDISLAQSILICLSEGSGFDFLEKTLKKINAQKEIDENKRRKSFQLSQT